ncbi:hypothetical protein KY289_005193 [Solanum tuberosum]|nr:hypothetical protein KY289_005193 [Solanum tuberosum]
MLNKLEGMLATSKNKQGVLGVLLNLCASWKKEKLHRVWDLFKQNLRIYNKGYISMMNSLMKFDDIEGVEQAEALFDRGLSKGGVPTVITWCHLASGYIHEDQVSKAIEALNKAMSICPPKFIPSKETLRTCVEYWENQGNVEKAEEFVRSLEVEVVFSSVFCEKLWCFINK